MQRLERYRSIIDDWPAFIDACRAPLPACVWANPERISPDALADRFRQTSVDFTAVPWYPGAFRLSESQGLGNRFEYIAGLYNVQEEIAMLPALLLAPLPGEKVLDLCAAPGNKTAQMVFMMQNKGLVVANDVNNNRLRALRQTINRLGLRNVAGTLYNAASFPRQSFQFDKVMVDVLCSCEGTSRKNPEVLHESHAHNPGGAQRAILRKALQLCRVGGYVLYSTCTYAPEENEMVIESALDNLAPKITAGLRPVDVPLRHSQGLTMWQHKRFRSDMQNAVRIYPHQNDTGGFFIALIEKIAESGKGYTRTKTDASAPVYEPVDRAVLLSFVGGRFGIPRNTFDDGRFFQANSKTVSYTSADDLALTPAPRIAGMPFCRARMRFPKIVTAACLAFGHLATKNVIELNTSQTEDFVFGKNVSVDCGQAIEYAHDGYVIARHQGHGIGLADAKLREHQIRLKSLFPKAWQRNVLMS